MRHNIRVFSSIVFLGILSYRHDYVFIVIAPSINYVSLNAEVHAEAGTHKCRHVSIITVSTYTIQATILSLMYHVSTAELIALV